MTETPAEALDFDLDSWLDGATVTQASVEILQRPDLLAEYEDWERRYKRAEQLSETLERAAGDPDPLRALEVEGEQLLEKMRTSRATWFVRALSTRDIDEINDAHPLPDGNGILFGENPPKPPVSPSETQAKAYIRSHKAWEERKRNWDADHETELTELTKDLRTKIEARGAQKIATAVVRIEVAGKVIAESVSFDQALALPRKIGEAQTQRILDAIDEATNAEPEVPAGFLSSNSEDDQI